MTFDELEARGYQDDDPRTERRRHRGLRFFALAGMYAGLVFAMLHLVGLGDAAWLSAAAKQGIFYFVGYLVGCMITRLALAPQLDQRMYLSSAAPLALPVAKPAAIPIPPLPSITLEAVLRDFRRRYGPDPAQGIQVVCGITSAPDGRGVTEVH